MTKCIERDTPEATEKAVCKEFLSAIVRDDSESLTTLICDFGFDLNLNYSYLKFWNGNEISRDISGPVLILACFFKKDNLGLQLIEAGAGNCFGSSSSDGWFGWSESSVSAMEQATSFEMPLVTKALMEHKEPFDWSYCASYDNDSQCTSTRGPSMISLLLGMQKTMAFIESVGVFRGLINGRLVVIRRYGADFTVEIDGATLENVKSLDEGLKKSMKAIECVPHTRNIEAFH